MTIVNFTPGPALAGGILIGLASVWLLLAHGRIAGISGIFNGLLLPKAGDTAWRWAFVLGLIAAGFLDQAVFGAAALPGSGLSIGWIIAAGLLVGFGTRMGSGCTSGHGVCGLGRLSARSLVSVLVFLSTGMATTFVMRHVIGGAA